MLFLTLLGVWYQFKDFFLSLISPVCLSRYLFLEIFCIGQQLLFWTSEELNLDSILWCFPAILNFTWLVSYSLIASELTFLIRIIKHTFRNNFLLQKVHLNQPNENIYQIIFFRIPKDKFHPKQPIP